MEWSLRGTRIRSRWILTIKKKKEYQNSQQKEKTRDKSEKKALIRKNKPTMENVKKTASI